MLMTVYFLNNRFSKLILKMLIAEHEYRLELFYAARNIAISEKVMSLFDVK